MKLENLQRESLRKELMKLSAAALDRGDEDTALIYYRAAKQLQY